MKKKDHCSFAPELNYAHCCKAHDKDYDIGGDKYARKAAEYKIQVLHQSSRTLLRLPGFIIFL